jgi:hypothetical protein
MYIDGPSFGFDQRGVTLVDGVRLGRDSDKRSRNSALADPYIRARFADLGGTVLPGSPADFGNLIANETEKWAKVIKTANIKPE